MTEQDTIAAPVTPPGYGGVGIVRVSGPAAGAIATAVAPPMPPPHRAALRNFRDSAGVAIDQGLVLWFPAPGSYTGEDTVEFHGHGGPAVVDALYARMLELGARPARPGEFTERAFLTGRLDLAQAEEVADLIESGDAAGARAAMRSLEGAFSRRVHALRDELTALRAWIEAALDFPEDEIDFLADTALRDRLDALIADLYSGRPERRQIESPQRTRRCRQRDRHRYRRDHARCLARIDPPRRRPPDPARHRRPAHHRRSRRVRGRAPRSRRAR
jgi:tRNA modification GTPase